MKREKERMKGEFELQKAGERGMRMRNDREERERGRGSHVRLAL